MVAKSPPGTRVEFRGIKRTLPQNDRMWAALTDVATQIDWHGMKLRPQDWKDIFTAGLKRELRVVPNLDGDGFVILGQHTSDMSIEEMGDLITLITAWGEDHGVVFHDGESPNEAA
jgi:hypothetical protein